MIGSATIQINFILVFIEGIFSFFSPCIIPLLPVYMSYLAGNTKNRTEEGVILYDRRKVLLHTVFFVLGISFAFFALGMAFTSLGNFFNQNRILFTRLSGILIIFLGLFQLGIFNFSFLQRERKINFKPEKINPVIAFLLGFTFSFAWTPCIGPMLSTVLLMASGAKTVFTGYALVLVYTAGFVIPFLLLGLFTTQVLTFLNRRKNLLNYTIKAGAIILILIGLMTFTGYMNGITNYLNSSPTGQSTNVDETQSNNKATKAPESNETSTDTAAHPEIDFTLTDQYGKTHTLSDYKGKVVFLNFWATWCPPCKKELPDIEELYKEYQNNQKDVVFLGITNPNNTEYPNNQDVTKPEIKSFLTKNGYTFPTLFDETGEILNSYQISAFPTTFIIDRNGNILGYVPGMMTKDIMKNVINQALESK